jgi:hypothetical protein
MAVTGGAALYAQRLAAAGQAALPVVSRDGGVQRIGARLPFSASDLQWHWDQRGDDKYLAARIEADALPAFKKGEEARLGRGAFVKHNVRLGADGTVCYFLATCPHSGTPAVKAEEAPPAAAAGARPAADAGSCAAVQHVGGSKQRGPADVPSKKVGCTARYSVSIRDGVATVKYLQPLGPLCWRAWLLAARDISQRVTLPRFVSVSVAAGGSRARQAGKHRRGAVRCAPPLHQWPWRMPPTARQRGAASACRPAPSPGM